MDVWGHSTCHGPGKGSKFCKMTRPHPWTRFTDTPLAFAYDWGMALPIYGRTVVSHALYSPPSACFTFTYPLPYSPCHSLLEPLVVSQEPSARCPVHANTDD